MNQIGDKERFEYAWKHFAFIAEQRIKIFNFYVILLAASFGATVTIFTANQSFWAAWTCGVWHILIACVFWLIEVRSKALLVIPKRKLQEYERRSDWVGRTLLLRDDIERKLMRPLFSFSGAFAIVHFFQLASGLAIMFLLSYGILP